MTRWATLRWLDGTRLARRDGDEYVVYARSGVADLFHQLPGMSEGIGRVPVAEADHAPLSPTPSRVICVGLNYADHIAEMGRERPTHPTLFTKFASTLAGAYDDLPLPDVSAHVDWEAELALVIGAPAYRLSPADALGAIGGYTVANDVSMRDWQRRTTQWLAGKAFDATTPLGPELVTPDEVDHARDLAVTCLLDGVVRQLGRTSDLVFAPADIVSYVSQFTRLEPGDVLLTGTPGGVGAATDDGLVAGQVLETHVEGIGVCRNFVVADLAATTVEEAS
ncbi:fumarylacetoacetate hydrolase family protein [Nocardioides humilatus]|uniref:Fumarylacetoacetate hydrolase family protein n=1 Tax=Nocardioides humilatus TaxID=2607660 RepID=A0A5B1L8Q1_9ACTN|nr:fumarylacetoacetate hydrolase family protein [Nocardioides humilatus]KAA1416965.1 fumarylacetoacetate hydrolase family protein [Nocardioides humilatus]